MSKVDCGRKQSVFEIESRILTSLANQRRASGRVLILDASQRSALAAVRSLGHRGLHVVTADTSEFTLAGASRFSCASLKYPDPISSPDQFVQAIAEFAERFKFDIVMPMTDVTTMLLAGASQSLNPARLSCAAADSYEALSSKDSLVTNARAIGIPTPATSVVTSKEAVLALGGKYGYPVVLKPSRSRYLHEGRIYATQVRIAHTREQLETICSTANWLDHIPGLVQEYIPGHGAGIFALGDGNQIVAWFGHRRIREKPPSGGVSVLSQSLAPDPALQAHAVRLLESVNWFGPAMVEFRVALDGTPYLMEVNGRFWGSLQLPIDCGVDFPWLLCELINGRQLTAQSSYKTGQRLRWMLGDVDNLLIQVRSQDSAGSKILALRDFATTFFDFSTRQEIFRWSDTAPGYFELKTWLRALA